MDHAVYDYHTIQILLQTLWRLKLHEDYPSILDWAINNSDTVVS